MGISQGSSALPEYSRVWCQGELQHERSLFVGPRPKTVMGSAKPGYCLRAYYGQHVTLQEC